MKNIIVGILTVGILGLMLSTFMGGTGVTLNAIHIHGEHLMSKVQVIYRCTWIAPCRGGGGGKMHRSLRNVMLYLLYVTETIEILTVSIGTTGA